MSEENNTNQVTQNAPAPAPHPYSLPQYAQQRQAEVQQPQIDVMAKYHEAMTELEAKNKILADPKYKEMDSILAANEAAKKKAEDLAASRGEFIYKNFINRREALSEIERKIAKVEDINAFIEDPLAGHDRIDQLLQLKAEMEKAAKAQVADDVTQKGAAPQNDNKVPSNFAEATALYLKNQKRVLSEITK